MNKASGGDRIPVELFQILKDDAVKMLHSICQQIGKTQQWPQDWKRSIFIPTPKKRKKVKLLSCVRLFVTPWTVVYHAPPFMGFSSKSTGVSCHFFLQRIFLNQVLNPDLPHCRQMLYHLGHWGSQSQRNAMPKKVQTTAQLHSSHTLAK